jgi:predicted Zn-dependent protease with MMP-like domain
MTPAERLRRANVSMFNARQMLSNGTITQEQFDNLDRQYQEIKAKAEAVAPAIELTPIQQETLAIADQIEALGQVQFADGMRSAVKRSGIKPDNLEFYKQKLQDFGAQKGAAEKPKESFDVASSLSDNEQKYYTSFQQNAPQPAKDAFAKLVNALDEVIA